MASKTPPRRFQERPGRPQASPRDLKTPPRRLLERPRCLQELPRRPHRASSRLQDHPRCPKTPPRRLQDASKTVQDASKRLQDSSKTPPGAPNTSRRGFHTPPNRFFEDFPTSFRQPDHKNQAPATARATFFKPPLQRELLFLYLDFHNDYRAWPNLDANLVPLWYQTSA